MNIPIILEPNSRLPVRVTENSAGYEIFASQEAMILPYTKTLIATGLRMQIPEGYFGMLTSKSGLARLGLHVYNAPAIIDSDFRGSIAVLLYNDNHFPIHIRKDDIIAQFMIMQHNPINWEVTQILSETDRNTLSFGQATQQFLQRNLQIR